MSKYNIQWIIHLLMSDLRMFPFQNVKKISLNCQGVAELLPLVHSGVFGIKTFLVNKLMK